MIPPADREALRQQLLTNGASVIAAAWRVGDTIDDLPPDRSDPARVACAQQERALEAAGPANPSPTEERMTTLDADLARFMDRLRARLAAGAETYGDASFTRPAAELVDEIMEELEDVCGWGLLLWRRLDRLRTAVDRIEALREES